MAIIAVDAHMHLWRVTENDWYPQLRPFAEQGDPGLPAATILLDWLESNDHVFDLVTQPESIPSWTKRLARHPNLRVVMEHTGWLSAVDAAGLQQWRAAITDLARNTDVVCKVSGLGMATMDLSENTLPPWIEGAVETFGWDRVAFGSNMPIETMAGTAAHDEQNRFYAQNARRTYQL